MTQGTRKLRGMVHTALETDVVKASREQSERVVNLLLAVINTVESETNTTALYQREIPLRELRTYATVLKRVGYVIDKIIAERIATLPTKRI